MFARRRNNRFILLALGALMIFGSTGFLIGYYLVPRNQAYDPQSLQAPDQNRIVESDPEPVTPPEVEVEPPEEQVVSSPEVLISEDTKIVYRTHFTQCQTIRDEVSEPMAEMIGLNESRLKEVLGGQLSAWQVVRFSGDQVILFQSKDQICPDHFWVSHQDGYIAVYQFNESGERILVEKTNISIAPLPKLDQDKLGAGILLRSMEDVNRLLEDYSS